MNLTYKTEMYEAVIRQDIVYSPTNSMLSIKKNEPSWLVLCYLRSGIVMNFPFMIEIYSTSPYSCCPDEH